MVVRTGVVLRTAGSPGGAARDGAYDGRMPELPEVETVRRQIAPDPTSLADPDVDLRTLV